MKVADIVPITKGVPAETLTYFTTEDVRAGMLVSITIKSRLIPGLILSVRDAKEEKASLRSAPFPVKKIEAVLEPEFFLPAFLTAVFETANYFSGTPGKVIKAFTPTIALRERPQKEASSKSAEKEPSSTREKKRAGKATPEKTAVQATEGERYAEYRSVIRSEFAHGHSVMVILPTIEEARHAETMLKKGIDRYSVLFHGKLSKTALAAAWEKIHEDTHPLLIIGTPQIFAARRGDVGTIILEREGSPFYKLPHAPYPDVRFFAEHFARALCATLIFGDILLRVETAKRVMDGELSEFSSLKWRFLSPHDMKIADMRTAPDLSKAPHQREKKKFRAVGDELIRLVEKTHEENARLIVYAGRKGLATMTVCADCDTVVLCRRCKSPVTLRLGSPDGKKDNFFVCSKCGERRSALERCKTCDSWKLTPLGIGTELVEKELRERFPKLTIVRIDKDAAKTDTAAKKAIEKFKNAPGSVLVGTELALLYANEPVERVAVATMDSLFALPDFRISEKALSLLLRLRSLAIKEFLVQTRMPDHPIFEYARAGNLIDFFRDEIKDRKEFGYAPEKLLIKISAEGDEDAIYDMMTELKKHLAARTLSAGGEALRLEIYPAFIRTVRGKYVLHGLLRLPPSAWPNTHLKNLLMSLPREFTVRVDPENLL